MPPILPEFLHQFFWGDRLDELNFNTHRQYILKTILEKGDRPASAWLLKPVGRKNLKQSLAKLSLSPKSANFWRLYLS